jgi:hypothetical protein
MRTYNTSHAYYCGVDLHARTLFVPVLDHTGQTRLERELPASPTAFLDALGPYCDGLAADDECMFAYGLADLCAREAISFVLGHALAMKAIHGGKAKNDRFDAQKIAGLLKGGFFPMAHAYPRDTRDPRPAATALVLRAPAGAVVGPHPEHELAVQPPVVPQEAHLQGQPVRPDRRAVRAPKHSALDHRGPEPDRVLRRADRGPREPSGEVGEGRWPGHVRLPAHGSGDRPRFLRDGVLVERE